MAINIRLYFQTISRTMFSFIHFFIRISRMYVAIGKVLFASINWNREGETENPFFITSFFLSFFASKLSGIAVVGSLSVTPSYHDNLYAKLPIMSNDIIHDLFTTNQFVKA